MLLQVQPLSTIVNPPSNTFIIGSRPFIKTDALPCLAALCDTGGASRAHGFSGTGAGWCNYGCYRHQRSCPWDLVCSCVWLTACADIGCFSTAKQLQPLVQDCLIGRQLYFSSLLPACFSHCCNLLCLCVPLGLFLCACLDTLT